MAFVRHRVIVRLVAGELEHFLFVAHRGAARAHLITGASVVFELRVPADRLQMAGIGPRHGERDALQRARKIRRRQVPRTVTRCFGVGDVLREHALALLVPLHARLQHRENRKIGNRHRPPLFG